MRAKRSLVILCYLTALLSLWPSKKKGPLREKQPHPAFSWGLLVIIPSVGVWSPADKLFLFGGPNSGSNWETQRVRGQTQLCQVLCGQLLFYQLQPPPPFNCTCTQTTCSFGCLMWQLTRWWKRSAELQLLQVDGLAYLMLAVYDWVFMSTAN